MWCKKTTRIKEPLCYAPRTVASDSNVLIEVRGAEESDYGSFARWFVDLDTGDKVPSPERWAMMAKASRIIERNGEPAGFVFATRSGAVAHVVQIVVDRAHRGERLGERLLRAIAADFSAQGATRWLLNVERDNTSAQRLYRRLGFETAFDAHALAIDRAVVDRAVVDGASDADPSAAPVDPSEDAAIEAALRLVPGAITRRRAGDTVVLRLVDRANAAALDVGVAAFSPSFPGASVFRVARPELAWPLLRALPPPSIPSPHINLLVENDEPLYQMLVAAGARVRFSMHQMHGDLPLKSSAAQQ